VEIVGGVNGGDGTGFQEVLIDTDETASVTARNIGHLLDLGTHHDDDTLDRLDVQVGLLTGDVLGSLDADLLASGDGTGEDTAEGGETATLVGGNHFGDVHGERSVRVAISDGLEGLIIVGAGVQIFGTVLLGLARGRQVTTDHGEESVSSVDPLLHAAFHELLADQFAVLLDERDLEGLEHLLVLLSVLVHDGHDELGDRSHDELTETAVVARTLVGVGPLLVLGGEPPITPQTSHHLALLDLELGGVDVGEALDVEGPAVETGTEGDGTLLGPDGGVTHDLVLVGGDENVDILDGLTEAEVHVLGFHSQLQDAAIDLVQEQARHDTLGKGLTEHGLGLDGAAFNAIDNNDGAIGDTKRGGHLRGEINMAGGIDQIDKVRLQALAVSGVALEMERDTGGLDGYTTLLLIGAGVGGASVTGGLGGDDTCSGKEGIGQGGLTVIDMRNNRHIADEVRVVHDGTQLGVGEIRHD